MMKSFTKYILIPVIGTFFVTYLVEYLFKNPITMDTRVMRAIILGLLVGLIIYLNDQYKQRRIVKARQ